MIKTKFSPIIEADRFHNKFAIKSNQLGLIQLWAWNNCYQFLNFQSGKVQKIAIDKIQSLQIVTDTEFYEKFALVNKPKEFFHKDGYFIGDVTLYSDRQRQYGLYHDNLLALHSEQGSNNKLWSNAFCRTIASIMTDVDFYTAIIKKWGNITTARKDENFQTFYRTYYFGGGPGKDNSVFDKYIGQTGLTKKDEITLEEKTIITYLKKVDDLPTEYKKLIWKFRKKNKEIKYYLALIK